MFDKVDSPGLLEEVSLSRRQSDFLFLSLFLSTIVTFGVGSLLMWDAAVFWPMLRVSAVCIGLISCFYIVSRFMDVSIGLLTCYALICLAAYTNSEWYNGVLFLGLAISFVLSCCRLAKIPDPAVVIRQCLLAAVFATLLFVGTRKPYTFFDMSTRLNAGLLHKDTLFHASIASMLKNYGISSTGLNGLVDVPYYVLSHYLMAGLSVLSGVSVLEVYGIAPYVFFGPILLFAIVYTSAVVGMKTDKLYQAYIAACLLLFGVVFLFKKWFLVNSYFISESHLVALGLMLVGMPLLFKKRLGLLDLVVVFAFAVSIANAKASVGLIYWGIWASRILFLRVDRRLFEAAVCILAMAAVFWTVFAIAANSDASKIEPFNFISDYSFWGYYIRLSKSEWAAGDIAVFHLAAAVFSVVSFFSIHFFVPICAIVVGWQGGVSREIRRPSSLFMVGSLAAGVLIVALFKIPGGSAYYFTSVPFFVALPWFLSSAINTLNIQLAVGAPRRHVTRVMGAVIIVLFFTVGFRDIYRATRLHWQNRDAANPLIGQLTTLRDTSSKNAVFRLSAASPSRDTPVAQCSAQPFVYPAVTERAWIDVIVSGGKCDYSNYGFSMYGISSDGDVVAGAPVLRREMYVLNWPE